MEISEMLLVLLPTALYIMGLMEGKKGRYAFYAGVAAHLLSIVERGIVIGTIPLTEKHDTISLVALSTAITYLYFRDRNKTDNDLGIVALPLISGLIVISFLHKPLNTFSPLLRTPWFSLHSFLFFLSYGFYGISFCSGIFAVLKKNSELEILQYRVAVIGWIFFSISLVAGSIWFYTVYGTYWIWTTRELWTTLTWFYYGLYLHARLLKELKGTPASLIGSLGYPVALFLYFGIGTIIPSPPIQY